MALTTKQKIVGTGGLGVALCGLVTGASGIPIIVLTNISPWWGVGIAAVGLTVATTGVITAFSALKDGIPVQGADGVENSDTEADAEAEEEEWHDVREDLEQQQNISAKNESKPLRESKNYQDPSLTDRNTFVGNPSGQTTTGSSSQQRPIEIEVVRGTQPPKSGYGG